MLKFIPPPGDGFRPEYLPLKSMDSFLNFLLNFILKLIKICHFSIKSSMHPNHLTEIVSNIAWVVSRSRLHLLKCRNNTITETTLWTWPFFCEGLVCSKDKISTSRPSTGSVCVASARKYASNIVSTAMRSAYVTYWRTRMHRSNSVSSKSNRTGRNVSILFPLLPTAYIATHIFRYVRLAARVLINRYSFSEIFNSSDQILLK